MNSNDIKKRILEELRLEYELNQIRREETGYLIRDTVIWFGLLAFAFLALLYGMIEKGGTWI